MPVEVRGEVVVGEHKIGEVVLSEDIEEVVVPSGEVVGGLLEDERYHGLDVGQGDGLCVELPALLRGGVDGVGLGISSCLGVSVSAHFTRGSGPCRGVFSRP